MLDYDHLMHAQAKRRLKIVIELIGSSPLDMDIDTIVQNAAKLAQFVERGAAAKEAKSKIDYPSYTKAAALKKLKLAPKRKYTKRSKVWGKKK